MVTVFTGAVLAIVLVSSHHLNPVHKPRRADKINAALKAKEREGSIFRISDEDEEVLALSDVISDLESSGRYRIVGPINPNGTQDYGRYQLNSNGIVSWSKSCLGVELTAHEILRNPKAQNMIARCRVRSCLRKNRYWDRCLAKWNYGSPFIELDRSGQPTTIGVAVKKYVKKGLKQAYLKYPRFRKHFRTPGGIGKRKTEKFYQARR